MPADRNAIEPIHIALRRVRWRLRAQAAMDGAGIAGVVAAGWLLFAGGLARFERGRAGWGFAGALCLLLAGALAGACRRISLRSAARRIDASHGLADRVGVALELSMLPLRPAFAQAAIEDAVQRIEGVRARRAAPFRRPRHVALASLGMLAGMLVWVARFPTPASGTGRGPVPAEANREAPLAIDPWLFEPEREAARELLSESEAAGDARAKAVASALLSVLAEVDARQLSRGEALARLEALGRDDVANPERERLRRVGAALSREPAARALADALRRGDLTEARRELSSLSERLGKPGSGERERKQIEKALANARGQRSGGSGSETLSALRSSVAKEERQARGRELARESREVVRRSAQRKSGGGSKAGGGGEGGREKRAGEANGKDAKTAGQDKRPGGSIEDRARGGEKGRGSERGSATDDGDAMRQFLRRAGSLRSEADPGAGNGGREGSGDGGAGSRSVGDDPRKAREGGAEAGDGNSKPGDGNAKSGDRNSKSGDGNAKSGDGNSKAGDGDQSRVAAERRPGGGDRPPSADTSNPNDRSERPDRANDASKPGTPILDDARRSPGDDQGQAGAGAKRGGADPTHPARSGIASDEGARAGEAGQRDARERRLSRIEVRAPGTAGGTVARPEAILRASEKGFATRSYRRVYEDYAAVTDEVLEREQVPPGYRFLVKRYFQLIRPRE